MRDPRLSAPLVIAAHGSTDPRFADAVEAIAAQVRAQRVDLDVRVGFLDHGSPTIAEVRTEACVVVPLLLAGGYHARVDIPAHAPGAVVTAAVGPDPLLAVALADRLREAGYDGTSPLTLAAAGSSDERALDDVRAAARQLGDLLRVPVSAAFVSAGTPRINDVTVDVVASYLLAPGVFHDALTRIGARVVSAPVGAHPAVADVVLARYDSCQVPGRIAPA